MGIWDQLFSSWTGILTVFILAFIFGFLGYLFTLFAKLSKGQKQ